MTPTRGPIAHVFRLSPRPELRGRLGDFRWAGRFWPLVAFAAIAALFYAWRGPVGPFPILIKLWAAYSTAWLALATLVAIKGVDAPWRAVLPTAIVGAALGGVVAAAVALAPNWPALLDASSVLPEWTIGAAFAMFFVALSLVAAEIHRRELLAADMRRQLLEARLQTLTAQIEPHFLMNTLANLRYLINSDSKAASQMLEHLADFLHGALERSRATHSTLGQELALVASYLTIMQFRLGERLKFRLAPAAELTNMPFPSLLLQTLVENALRHGIEPRAEGGLIEITIDRQAEQLVLCVRDDGVGLAAGSEPGVGLRNTRERLASFYAGRASFDLLPGTPSGTVAAVSIPAPAA